MYERTRNNKIGICCKFMNLVALLVFEQVVIAVCVVFIVLCSAVTLALAFVCMRANHSGRQARRNSSRMSHKMNALAAGNDQQNVAGDIRGGETDPQSRTRLDSATTTLNRTVDRLARDFHDLRDMRTPSLNDRGIIRISTYRTQ